MRPNSGHSSCMGSPGLDHPPLYGLHVPRYPNDPVDSLMFCATYPGFASGHPCPTLLPAFLASLPVASAPCVASLAPLLSLRTALCLPLCRTVCLLPLDNGGSCSHLAWAALHRASAHLHSLCLCANSPLSSPAGNAHPQLNTRPTPRFNPRPSWGPDSPLVCLSRHKRIKYCALRSKGTHGTALEAALRRGQPWLPRQVVLQGKWAVKDEMRCSNESSARYGGAVSGQQGWRRGRAI